MKVIGIVGSPRAQQMTRQVVDVVLEGAGADVETEVIFLGSKSVGPCIGCLACAKDNVCKVQDDLADLRETLLKADGWVLGGANYYGRVNGVMQAFLERMYQFHHMASPLIADKPVVAVGVGGMMPEPAVASIEAYCGMHRLRRVASVAAQGPAPCFSCGLGEECPAGVVQRVHGAGTKITEAIIPSLEKQSAVREAALQAGQALRAACA